MGGGGDSGGQLGGGVGVRARNLRRCPALPQACRVELGEDEARDDSSTVVVVLV